MTRYVYAALIWLALASVALAQPVPSILTAPSNASLAGFAVGDAPNGIQRCGLMTPYDSPCTPFLPTLAACAATQFVGTVATTGVPTNRLNVTVVSSGSLKAGLPMPAQNGMFAAGTIITGQISGTGGAIGVYQLSQQFSPPPSFQLTVQGDGLTQIPTRDGGCWVEATAALPIGSGNITGVSPSGVHAVATWNNAVGTSLIDPAQTAQVFTNTQMNLYALSLLSGISPAVEYPGSFAGNFATEALTGGVAVPGAATVFQANAVAGYADNSSTTTNAVAVFGLMKAKAAGVHNWGLNTVCEDGNFAIAECVNELDVNIHNAGTAVANGLGILGASTVAPQAGNAISIGPMGPGVKWPTSGVFVGDGAAVNAYTIGKTASGSAANIGSQALLWDYTNGSGAAFAYNMSVDTTGSLDLVTSAGSGSANAMIDGSLTLNAPATGFAILNFSDTRITKYQFFRDTGDNFTGRDNIQGLSFLTVGSGQTSIGESGGILNLIGNVVIANPGAAPAGSVCVDGAGHLTIKSTAGSCI